MVPDADARGEPKQTLETMGVHSSWARHFRTSENDPFYNAAFDFIDDVFGRARGATVVDAGCGSATKTLQLLRRGYRVRGLDFSEAILQQAKAAVAAAGQSDHVTFETADLTALTLADASVDRMLCWGVMMHIPDVEKVVVELSRVLAPGGILVVSEGNVRIRAGCRATGPEATPRQGARRAGAAAAGPGVLGADRYRPPDDSTGRRPLADRSVRGAGAAARNPPRRPVLRAVHAAALEAGPATGPCRQRPVVQRHSRWRAGVRQPPRPAQAVVPIAMRIAFVTQIVPYPPHGGVLQRGYNLLRELGREHDVHLLAFHHPDELPPGEPVEQSKAALLGKFCASVEYFPLWPKQSPVHKAVGAARGVALSAARSACSPTAAPACAGGWARCAPRRRRPTSSTSTPSRWRRTATSAATVPAVLDAPQHRVAAHGAARRGRVGAAGAPLRRPASAPAAATTSASSRPAFPLNIMVSEADAAQLRTLVPGVRTAVVPNGVDTDYFTPRHGAETPARDLHRRHEHVREPRRASSGSSTRSGRRSRRRSRTSASSRSGSVRARGCWRPPRRIQRSRRPASSTTFAPGSRKSAVYVVPLRVGGGTRLKMVDAMAQGKAIVATTRGRGRHRRR